MLAGTDKHNHSAASFVWDPIDTPEAAFRPAWINRFQPRALLVLQGSESTVSTMQLIIYCTDVEHLLCTCNTWWPATMTALLARIRILSCAWLLQGVSGSLQCRFIFWR